MHEKMFDKHMLKRRCSNIIDDLITILNMLKWENFSAENLQ